jgi:hypothetical protein
MYKIVIKKVEFGYKVLLMHRFCWIWFHVVTVKIEEGCAYMAIDQIHIWMRMFNIPLTRVENVNIL